MHLFKILLVFCFSLAMASCGRQSVIPIRESVLSVGEIASDSMFVNKLYSKQILRAKMAEVDSLEYYYLLSVYDKVCFTGGEYDSVLLYANRVLDYCAKQSDTTSVVHSLISSAYNLTGNVWGISNRFDSALCYYNKAYKHAQRSGEASPLVDICINMADMNLQSGRYGEAAQHYRNALFICDSVGLPSHSRFPIYYGLGQAYCDLRNFELCDKFYKRAEVYFDRMTPSEKFVYLNNRGNSYYFRHDYVTALQYMRRAYRITKQVKDMVWQSNLCRVNLGELYLLTGKPDSAQWALSSCRPFFERTKNRTALYYIDTQMIELAIQQGDMQKAAQLIDRTDHASEQDVGLNILLIRKKYLQHYYEEKNDYKKAYEYLRCKVALNDSLKNMEVLMRVSELAMRYKQDTLVLRKELLIQQQASKMHTMHVGSVFLGIVCVLLVVIFFIFVRSFRKQRALSQERHLNQITRLRMENIRNHVSPHFTFNVLNRQLSVLKGHDEEAYDNLFNLVKLLRRSLELTDSLSVSLKEELDFIQVYLKLEDKRVGDDFHYRIEVSDEIDPEQIRIPSVMVQTAVENALKHGLAGLEREKRLDILVKKGDRGAYIQVIDNGRGFNPGFVSPNRGTGTGFKVLYQTVQLLNKKNKNEKITVDVKAVPTSIYPTGTIVTIYIPFNYTYEL